MLIILSLSVLLVLLNKENLSTIPVIVSFVLIVIVCVLIIPIGGLTGFHLVLVSRGRTTNEQVTGKFRTGVNPFDMGCLRNWSRTVCIPVPPSYIKFRRKRQIELEYYQTKMLVNKYNYVKYSHIGGQMNANNNSNSNKKTEATKTPAISYKSQGNDAPRPKITTTPTEQTVSKPAPQRQKISNVKQQSTAHNEPDYVYDTDKIWLQTQNNNTNNNPSSNQQNPLKIQNKNLLLVSGAHQNGSYRAMDKNVGTNLEQQLLNAAAQKKLRQKNHHHNNHDEAETERFILNPLPIVHNNNNNNNTISNAGGRQTKIVKNKSNFVNSNSTNGMANNNLNFNRKHSNQSNQRRIIETGGAQSRHNPQQNLRNFNNNQEFDYDSYEITV
jgi:hypothetical protein